MNRREKKTYVKAWFQKLHAITYWTAFMQLCLALFIASEGSRQSGDWWHSAARMCTAWHWKERKGRVWEKPLRTLAYRDWVHLPFYSARYQLSTRAGGQEMARMRWKCDEETACVAIMRILSTLMGSCDSWEKNFCVRDHRLDCTDHVNNHVPSSYMGF